MRNEGSIIQAAAGHVFNNADHEMVLRLVDIQVVEDALYHGGRELLGTETVAASHNQGIGLEFRLFLGHGFADSGTDVQIERLAQGARLFGPVEDGDLLYAFRQGRYKGVDGEGAIEANLYHADLLPLGCKVLNGFVDRVGAGAHDNDDTFRIRRANIINQFILAAGQFGELVHLFLNDVDTGGIVWIDRLAPLEIDIRVLRRAAHDRMVR